MSNLLICKQTCNLITSKFTTTKCTINWYTNKCQSTFNKFPKVLKAIIASYGFGMQECQQFLTFLFIHKISSSSSWKQLFICSAFTQLLDYRLCITCTAIFSRFAMHLNNSKCLFTAGYILLNTLLILTKKKCSATNKATYAYFLTYETNFLLVVTKWKMSSCDHSSTTSSKLFFYRYLISHSSPIWRHYSGRLQTDEELLKWSQKWPNNALCAVLYTTYP